MTAIDLDQQLVELRSAWRCPVAKGSVPSWEGVTPAPLTGSLVTRRWSKGDSNLYGAFPVKWLFWVLLRVLCSEVCPGKASMFSRRQSCRGKSQSPVVRIAEEMETEPSKPLDKISRGEITSHRAVSKENALWPRKK